MGPARLRTALRQDHRGSSIPGCGPPFLAVAVVVGAMWSVAVDVSVVPTLLSAYPSYCTLVCALVAIVGRGRAVGVVVEAAGVLSCAQVGQKVRRKKALRGWVPGHFGWLGWHGPWRLGARRCL